ncbi:uncharacterized protein LOC135982482 [Chrysemys picta bellii]|uniref:uncharacterized protein LOC135982482 n=1 Tax=Chrysemys picta bellii TaxID=8478 RepID=UPI0032B13C18
MPAPRTRRSPAWSNAKLLVLICIWGEEAVQSQLCSSRRNYDTYGQISRYITERGHDRDTLQYRVKVKELQNAYHRAREANCRSGAAPTSCRFYKELNAILSCDPPPPLRRPLWILQWLACQSRVDRAMRRNSWVRRGTQRQRMSQRPEMHAARSSFLPWRRLASHSSRIVMKRKQKRRPLESPSDLQETLVVILGNPLSQVLQQSCFVSWPINEMTLGAQPPSLLSAAERLCRIRKHPRRTKEDFLCDVMMHSATEKQELKE